MKRVYQQNGITLIALVITIIVLLILAGVTMNLTLGENGIFKTAQQAAKNYTDAENRELTDIENFNKELSNIIAGTGNDVAEGLPENTPTTPSGTLVKRPEGKTWDETKIYSYADGIGNTIPVPVGFKPITVAEGQGTKLTGFVIKNEEDDNEFVWVPVEGMNYNYERYSGWNYNGFSETLSSDENESVATYGGYYIGRYEGGIKGGTLSSIVNSGNSTNWTGWTEGTLVVQQGAEVWNYITRDKAIEVTTGLYDKTKDNVTSKLCSSYAWDTALRFIETQNSEYPTNSVGGYYEQSKPTTTGYDTTHPCNIYDMGGNVDEWTTETSNDILSPCTVRGGSYAFSSQNDPACGRDTHSDQSAVIYVGLRVTLFM